MLEISDAINIGSIACEVVGFVLLLPRIKDWLKFKNDAKPQHWNFAWKILTDYAQLDFEECKKYFDARLKYGIEEEEYKMKG